MNRQRRRSKEFKKIKEVAPLIVQAEKEIRLGKDVQLNKDKIENIMCSLSFQEMLLLDDYIMQENFLTK